MLPEIAVASKPGIEFVSRAMSANSLNHIGTPTDLFWDGFFAYCENKPLEDMPSEHQRKGWWHANMSEAETQALVDGREDEDFWRKGC